MKVEDKFDIIFSFGKSDVRQVDLYWSIMDILDRSFLPRITYFDVPDRRKRKIDGAKDLKVLNAIKNEKLVELRDENKQIEISLIPVGRINMIIVIHKDIIKNISPQKIIDLFRSIIEVKTPIAAEASFFQISKYLNDEFYNKEPRTRRSMGLVWLQYFGKEEFERQGGKEIFKNEYIKAESLAEGILVQVGDGPFDGFKSKGIQLFTKATNAMPKIN